MWLGVPILKHFRVSLKQIKSEPMHRLCCVSEVSIPGYQPIYGKHNCTC